MILSSKAIVFDQPSLMCVCVVEQDKISKDDFLGGFMFDLNEVPSRKPPESPLAPQWYKLEEKNGKGRVRGIQNSQIAYT